MGSGNSLLAKENLNLVIAVCAILVSAASFYATFLQADSADQQVRAMTLPLLTFDHSNYDEVMDRRALSFALQNSGVGPAIIHSIQLVHDDAEYSSIFGFLRDCCAEEYLDYERRVEELGEQNIGLLDGGMLTNSLTEVVLAGQSDYLFFQLFQAPASDAFWNKLERERWALSLDICYCTLLGDCFESEGGIAITEIEYCPAN